MLGLLALLRLLLLLLLFFVRDLLQLALSGLLILFTLFSLLRLVLGRLHREGSLGIRERAREIAFGGFSKEVDLDHGIFEDGHWGHDALHAEGDHVLPLVVDAGADDGSDDDLLSQILDLALVVFLNTALVRRSHLISELLLGLDLDSFIFVRRRCTLTVCEVQKRADRANNRHKHNALPLGWARAGVQY